MGGSCSGGSGICRLQLTLLLLIIVVLIVIVDIAGIPVLICHENLWESKQMMTIIM
jgi:hypothetical protein